MISAAQIRAARAMIGLSIEELASATSLSSETIAGAESGSGSGDETIGRIIRDALEARGVVFIANGDDEAGGPGIRLKRGAQADDATRPENLNAANDD